MSTLLPLPSALAVLIWSLPSVPWSTSSTNTTCLPSADQCPSKCGPPGAGTRNGLRSVPSAFMTHRPILPWCRRVKRKRLPSGDQHRCCLKSPSCVSRRGAEGSPPRHKEHKEDQRMEDRG